MGGGKSPTTNVTNTGIGDSQYMGLMNQHQSTQNQIRGIETGARDEIRRLEQPIGRIETGVRDLSGDLRFGLADVNRNIAGQTQQIGSQFNDVNRNIAGIDNTVGNVARDVTAGFGDMNNQFNQVGSQLTDLGNNVSTGFANTNQAIGSGFADTNANMNTQFDRAAQERLAGFSGLGDMVGTGFAGQADFLTNMSSNILGGQNNLQNLLNQTGGRLDAYYGDLSSGQQGIANQVGNVQGGLNDFTNQYGRDTALANRQRADIQQTQQSGTERVTNDLARMQGANSVAQQRLMDAVGGMGTSGGLAGPAPEQAQTAVAQQVNMIRELLGSIGQNLDPNTRAQYADLATSFDEGGNLIANSNDANGFRVNRAMDNAGNLFLNRFDQAGNRASSNVLNVPNMFQQAEAFRRMMTEQQAPVSGLASPDVA
jgi:archaellum component FlaC